MHAPATARRSPKVGEGAEPMNGLTEEEAQQRLRAAGRNELEGKRGRTLAAAAIEQIKSPLVLLLLGGAGISAFVGHFVDASAIAIIVTINTVVGIVQERRAERAVAALQRMTARRATVVRDGRTRVVEAAEIVEGDLLVLEPGGVVAADAELVEVHNL